MGLRTVARLVGNHLQNVAMLAGLNVGWPDSFKELFGWTRIFNIDLSALMIKLRLPTVTQRLVFIAVSIAVPLSLMLLTSLVFFSISAIVQIALVICGVSVLVLHTMSFADPTLLAGEYQDSVSDETVLWVGFAGVGLVLLYRLVRRKSYSVASSILWIGTMLFGLTVLDAGEIAKRVVLSLFSVFFFAFWYLTVQEKNRFKAVFGSIAVMAIIIWLSGLWSVRLPGQIRFVGWILVVLGTWAIVSRVASLVSTRAALRQITAEKKKEGAAEEGGGFFVWVSKVRSKVQRIIDTGLLTLILLILMLVYAPVITNALQLFVCETYTCPPGYAFNPHVERPENEPFTVSPDVFCEMCNFTASCGFSTYDLCPGWSSRRLLYDPATTCDDSSYVSFIVAAILVMVVFVVILQIMYVKVITICTKVMCVKAKYMHDTNLMTFQEEMQNQAMMWKEIDPPNSFEEQWEDTTIRVAPKASSLYDAFRFSMRYFILVDSVYKTLEVLATTFLSPITPAASVMSLAAHFVFFILLILLKPFADPKEQWLSALLSACLVMDGFYAIFMWVEPGFFGKDGWAIGMLFFNVLIPAIGGTYLLYVSVRNQFCRKTLAEKQKEEEQKKEKEKSKEEQREDRKFKKREKMKQRMEKRQKEHEHQMAQIERMYAIQTARDKAARRSRGGGGLAGDDLESDGSSPTTAEAKSHKDLKREQMSPSEKLSESLNGFTKKIILLYFAFLAIPLLCAALVLTLISGSISGNTEFVDSSNFFDRSQITTLNNLASWQEFAAFCCCFETQKFTARGSNLTERWICMDFANTTTQLNGTAGSTFFRTRLDNAGNDGLPIRPMCGTHTVRECVTRINSPSSVVMDCEEPYIKQHNLTQFAIDVLW